MTLATLFSCNPLFARFYIGVEGGWTGFKTKIEEYERDKDQVKVNKAVSERFQGVVGNITLGTEHFFFNNYFGLRWGIYGGYGYAQGKTNKYDLGYMGVNFDLMGNFISNENLTFGAFAGIDGSITALLPDKVIRVGKRIKDTGFYASNRTVALNPNLRLGLSVLLAQHHRIELTAKLPMRATNQVSSNQDVLISNGAVTQNDFAKYAFRYDYLQVFASYKYLSLIHI